jgi:hypothetical protein
MIAYRDTVIYISGTVVDSVPALFLGTQHALIGLLD